MRRGVAKFVVAVALGLLGATCIDAAPSSPRMYRIGFLSTGSAPPTLSRGDSDFQQGLRDFGYIEGENVVIEYRYANGSVDRLPDLAADLVRLPVDVIVTSGESAALAAKRATKMISIVATEFGLDPVKAGLVTSLGRPDANVTGMATLSEELWQKRLALLKEAAPGISHLAVLWNPANPGNKLCVDAIKAFAATMSIQARYLEVSDPSAVERALASIAKEPSDALAICWDGVTLASARTIANFGLIHRVPTVAPLREYADAGALMSFGMSLSAHRRHAAYYVDKILKGTKPSDIPVEQPTIFEWIINQKTAKALGIALSATSLLLADELIK